MRLRLRELRLRRALSQRDLAARAGMSQATIVALERGHAQPRPSTLRKLAAALGADPGELWTPDAAEGRER